MKEKKMKKNRIVFPSLPISERTYDFFFKILIIITF